MKRISHTRAEVARLADLVLETLPRRPEWTVQQLAVEVGFGVSGVRNKLLDLQHRGLAHFVQRPTKGDLGITHFWRNGPAPAAVDSMAPTREQCATAPQPAARVDTEPMDQLPGDCQLRQHVTSVYPEHRLRDPLVAALFGPGPGAHP